MCELFIINELFWIKQKLVSGVASLLFKLCGGQTVKGCRKKSDNNIRQNRCHVLTSLSSKPQAPSGHRAWWKEKKVTVCTLIAALCWRVFVPEEELDFLFPRAPFLQMFVHHVFKGDCSF